jgi:hypothetical protein
MNILIYNILKLYLLYYQSLIVLTQLFITGV